jgi:hypothetical protein
MPIGLTINVRRGVFRCREDWFRVVWFKQVYFITRVIRNDEPLNRAVRNLTCPGKNAEYEPSLYVNITIQNICTVRIM